MSSAREAEVAMLDTLVELLAEGPVETDTSGFYHRVCEAICRLTSLERAGVVLYDPIRATATPVGSHGVDPEFVSGINATLEETPMAQRALATGEVVVVSGDLRGEVPDRYAAGLEGSSLACAPVAAGGHWFGVIIADWNGARAELPEHDRQIMRGLGRLSALAGSVERATRQRERAGRLNERIALIRDIHDQVIQRLFGLSMVLGSGQPISEAEQERCASEVHSVLGDLRTALGRTPSEDASLPPTTLREIIDGQAEATGLSVRWEDRASIPAELEPLAQSFAVEALRNAQRHAQPTEIEIRVSRSEQALEVEIINDGVAACERASGAGLGLRLLTLEALRNNGLVEFGPIGRDQWKARLLAPVKRSQTLRDRDN